MKKILLLFILVSPFLSFSQVNRFSQPSAPARFSPLSYEELARAYQRNYSNSNKFACSDLYSYIIKNGRKESTVSKYVLDSSWLKEVTSYKYNNYIFVVASISTNEYSSETNKYIFCKIPSNNWNSFRYSVTGTYGERFHKYIFDYKCDCE